MFCLSPMKIYNILLALMMGLALSGCGSGNTSPSSEQSESKTPKSDLPENITVTPVTKGKLSDQEQLQPGQLKLGQATPKSKRDDNSEMKLEANSGTRLQEDSSVTAQETESPAKLEGEAKLTQKNGQYFSEDSPFDGQFIDHHDNGQKSVEGTFVEGKQQGVWTFYHENGQQFRTGNYVDGRADGQWIIWREDGSKWAEQTYINGQLNGLEKRWHPNGQKQSEATWQGGKTISKSEWDEQGVLKP
ncbi:MAG: hypothetical protein VYE44_05985 [Verrucomicrobiota bacterium]|nr:hypothetical protein [Verrucomicrobiota bacterium]